MTTEIVVERLTFTFASGVHPHQYEVRGVTVAGWPKGTKVVDIVVNQHEVAETTCWFIEAKDYRIIGTEPRPKNNAGLAETVAEKVRSSIDAMPIVAEQNDDETTRAHASAAASAKTHRVVLHLEPHPPDGPAKHLFPREFSADVLQKLKRLVADVAPGPLVLDLARTERAGVPWRVR